MNESSSLCVLNIVLLLSISNTLLCPTILPGSDNYFHRLPLMVYILCIWINTLSRFMFSNDTFKLLEKIESNLNVICILT